MSIKNIDKLIEKYKTKTEKASRSIDRTAHYDEQEYRQIVQYLEELKEYKEVDKNKLQDAD